MFVASLLGHSLPPLPTIAFPDLTQYWTRGWGISKYLLATQTFLLGLFHENIVSLNNSCDWLLQNWWIWVQGVMFFQLFIEVRKSIWQPLGKKTCCMCVFIICDGSCSLGILSRVFLGTGIEACFKTCWKRKAAAVIPNLKQYPWSFS